MSIPKDRPYRYLNPFYDPDFKTTAAAFNCAAFSSAKEAGHAQVSISHSRCVPLMLKLMPARHKRDWFLARLLCVAVVVGLASAFIWGTWWVILIAVWLGGTVLWQWQGTAEAIALRAANDDEGFYNLSVRNNFLAFSVSHLLLDKLGIPRNEDLDDRRPVPEPPEESGFQIKIDFREIIKNLGIVVAFLAALWAIVTLLEALDRLLK